ncbi:hypothetical protein EVAR_67734_1 [Eumeta japonica]|uniref:Uncharacterized protein n=1 Tax=Eumeta variegata TaxID=151549 RepID=A0A4C1ZG11_EUMVA|nr:hypothetical protein EVAR_67734_1 [Eumeta japonica]
MPLVGRRGNQLARGVPRASRPPFRRLPPYKFACSPANFVRNDNFKLRFGHVIVAAKMSRRKQAKPRSLKNYAGRGLRKMDPGRREKARFKARIGRRGRSERRQRPGRFAPLGGYTFLIKKQRPLVRGRAGPARNAMSRSPGPNLRRPVPHADELKFYIRRKC